MLDSIKQNLESDLQKIDILHSFEADKMLIALVAMFWCFFLH